MEIIEEEKEEWMFMLELNLQELSIDIGYNSTLVFEGYWYNVSEYFDDVDLFFVIFWLNIQKNKNELSWYILLRVIDILSFSSD